MPVAIVGSTEDIRTWLCGPQQHNEHCKGWRWHMYVQDDKKRMANVWAELQAMHAERRARLEALRSESGSTRSCGVITMTSLGKFNENVAAIWRSMDARSEEIRAAYQRIAQLEADLHECLEYFEDKYDVSDGDYGEPSPNKEMQLGTMLKETLYGPGAF